MKDVFISYKAEELEEANWVRTTLETNGISCWMAPANIPGGSSYAVEIPQAIRQAKVFVLILSARAQSSRWISREVDLAINEGKIVLPFMLENCALKDDFNFYLTNVQRYEAYENKVAAIEKMLREIKTILGEGTPSPAAPVYTDNTRNFKTPVPARTVTPPPAAKPKIDPCAIWSLVLGVVNIALLGVLFLPDIAAMALAVWSVARQKRLGLRGKPLALIGLILGTVGLFIASASLLGVPGAVVSLAVSAVTIGLYEWQGRR